MTTANWTDKIAELTLQLDTVTDTVLRGIINDHIEDIEETLVMLARRTAPRRMIGAMFFDAGPKA